MKEPLLDALLAATAAPEPANVTLRTLTLHMLRSLAPRLFEARALRAHLQEGLARCGELPFAYEGGAAEVEIGVDAHYLRALHGLPVQSVDGARSRQTLERLEREGDALHAWLLGEMLARVGLDVRLPFEGRPFRSARLLDGYFLTHLVMIDSDFFARPVRHPSAPEWAAALTDLVGWLERKPNADLLGEVAVCLRFLGADAAHALRLVATAEPSDAHCTATLLLANALEA